MAADLVSRACIRDRISKGSKQPVILHAENSIVRQATTQETG